jgi:hypothetical protein
MRKITLLALAACLCASVVAQDAGKQDGQLPKKNTGQEKEDSKMVSLDGKSFKVSFTEKRSDAAPGTVSRKEKDKINNKEIQADKPDYSLFDLNSKVLLSFSGGNLLSPVFAGTGCPYKVNTSGESMLAFSAHCILNSGNAAVKMEKSSQDTKLEMDAANATDKTAVTDPAQTDVVKVPNTMPPDETKQHIPPGTARDDNAGTHTTPPANIPPSEQIQNQAESPVQSHSGTMATISGVVSGNSIQGTLSWTDAEGKRMSYSYSGSAATKKDMDEIRTVGMK